VRVFPIQQAIAFRVLDGSRRGTTGQGNTTELSSHAVHFTTDCQIEREASVELSIDWPMLLDGQTPLKLVVKGTVIRHDQGTVVVSVQRFEFRIRRR
jgi:hypothetical protein